MLSINQPSANLSFLEKLTKQREEKIEQLSSGKRINQAADDAAGLQISNRFTSEINQNQQLSFNAQDQANIYHIEAGALSSINDGLLRAQTLSIQSGSPLYDSNVIQGELDQITEQINTIASEVLGQDNFISTLDANDPTTTQAIIDDTATSVQQSASDLGANINSFGHQVATYETVVINSSASRSRIEDTDFAKTTSEKVTNEILLQSAIAVQKAKEENKGLLINKLI